MGVPLRWMFSNKVIGQISPNELIIISLTYY